MFRVGTGGTLMKNERTKGVFTENVCMSCIVVLVTELYCCFGNRVVLLFW